MLKKNIANVFRCIKQLKHKIQKHYKVLIATCILGCIIYPLLFLAGIDFASLYNIPHINAYLISLPFFLIPLLGILAWKYLKNPYSFTAFWLIFHSIYFLTGPHIVAGNFGFYGFFQDYIINVHNKNLFHSILVPDTGYIAILPRIIYSLSALVNPSLTQIIAITSLISVILYAFIMSRLLHHNLNFLWVNKQHAIFIVTIISLFPIFSLTPGLQFPLPITDIAYFGILFIISSVFIIANKATKNTTGYIVLSIILSLSKAHMVVLLPLMIPVILYSLIRKNRKLLVYSVIVTTGIIIQALFCYLSLQQVGFDDPSSPGSFTIEQQSLVNLIIYAIIYFVKSYSVIFVPINNPDSIIMYWGFWVSIPLIICMFTIAIKNLIRKNSIQLSLWFLACNIIAFTSAIFYAYTAGVMLKTTSPGVEQLISGVEINMMRYTIGVHSLLTISVIPFVVITIRDFFSKYTKHAGTISIIAITVLISCSLLTQKNPITFTEFWKLAKNDSWSKEWSKLTPLINNDQFYIPTLFYPEFKMNIHTHQLEVKAEFFDEFKSGYCLSDSVMVHSVIVLTNNQVCEDSIACEMVLFYNDVQIKILKSAYKNDDYFRFIVFTTNQAVLTDSISFCNSNHKPIPIGSYISVIGLNQN